MQSWRVSPAITHPVEEWRLGVAEVLAWRARTYLFSMSFACVGLLPEEDDRKAAGMGDADTPFCLDVQWVKATVDA